jgi:hypothetical protein
VSVETAEREETAVIEETGERGDVAGSSRHRRERHK